MKFRKKPVVIEAVKWNGKNYQDISEFMKAGGGKLAWYGDDLVIETLEGNMKAEIGDYIIRGVNNEYYPCKDEIFWKTYERVIN